MIAEGLTLRAFLAECLEVNGFNQEIELICHLEFHSKTFTQFPIDSVTERASPRSFEASALGGDTNCVIKHLKIKS